MGWLDLHSIMAVSLSRPVFRSYNPKDESLKEAKLPTVTPMEGTRDVSTLILALLTIS